RTGLDSHLRDGQRRGQRGRLAGACVVEHDDPVVGGERVDEGRLPVVHRTAGPGELRLRLLRLFQVRAGQISPIRVVDVAPLADVRAGSVRRTPHDELTDTRLDAP